ADDDLMAQFFGPGGAPLGAAFAVEDAATFEVGDVTDAVVMGDGRLAMAWHSKHRTQFDSSAKVMIYNTDGSPALPAPMVIAEDIAPGLAVRMAALADGGFITVHVDADRKFILSRFDAAGVLQSSGIELRSQQAISPTDSLNLTSSHSQVFDIEMTAEGQIVLAYVVYVDSASETDVRYGIFELDGSVVLDSRAATDNLPDEQSEIELTRLNDGTVFLAFADDTDIRFSSQQSINGVRIQGGEKPESPLPTPGPDFIFGTDGDDVIDLLDGADFYAGQAGDDSVHGNDGEDLLDGGEGNDTLSGGGNDDTIRGGADEDTAAFRGSSAAATVRETEGGLLVHTRDGTDFVRDDVENFLFDDTTLSYTQMEALVGRAIPDVTGTDAADALYGTP
ncbi:calcium-binding protein, partial [Cribrihabitans sp. XS_ASV171]